MFKLIVKTVAICLGAIVLIIAVAAGYRVYGQHMAASELAINTRNGIIEAGFHSIGDIEQWIQIRGEDRSNPVLLFLHGGPSMSMIPFTYRAMRPWEKQFTVVHWDQRGAGRTYIHNAGTKSPASNIERIIADGLEVAAYLRRHLYKEKIIVIGESFGSVVGVEMARRRPDLFYAYIGTGQIVNMAQTQVVGYRIFNKRVHATGAQKSFDACKKSGRLPTQIPPLGTPNSNS